MHVYFSAKIKKKKKKKILNKYTCTSFFTCILCVREGRLCFFFSFFFLMLKVLFRILPTSDHKARSLNPAGGGGIQSRTVWHFICSEPFIITFLSSQYDLDSIERDVKHQIIIIIIRIVADILFFRERK